MGVSSNPKIYARYIRALLLAGLASFTLCSASNEYTTRGCSVPEPAAIDAAGPKASAAAADMTGRGLSETRGAAAAGTGVVSAAEAESREARACASALELAAAVFADAAGAVSAAEAESREARACASALELGTAVLADAAGCSPACPLAAGTTGGGVPSETGAARVCKGAAVCAVDG